MPGAGLRGRQRRLQGAPTPFARRRRGNSGASANRSSKATVSIARSRRTTTFQMVCYFQVNFKLFEFYNSCWFLKINCIKKFCDTLKLYSLFSEKKRSKYLVLVLGAFWFMLSFVSYKKINAQNVSFKKALNLLK